MKKILNLIVVLFVTVQLSAQNKTKPATQTGLLWEITGKDLKEPSYLFGTYHLMGKSYTDTLPALLKIFSSAKTVVGEIVMEDEMAMAQKMMPYMQLKGTTLDKLLSPTELSELDAFLKAKVGIPTSALNAFKPGAVQVIILSSIAPKSVSPENPSLDMFFQKEAVKAGKAVAGLETIEQQSELLLNTPLDKQKNDLMKTVRESDRMIKESLDLYNAYKAGDLSWIEKAFTESKDFTQEDVEKLVNGRNKNWIKIFPGYMSKGPTFFAVGAGHLPGQEGMLSLLRKAGYTVNPVSLK